VMFALCGGTRKGALTLVVPLERQPLPGVAVVSIHLAQKPGQVGA
jgi:hypothetical protein